MIRWMAVLAALMIPMAAEAQDHPDWPKKAFEDWRVYRNEIGCWIVNDQLPGGGELSLSTGPRDRRLYVDFINYDWPWEGKGAPPMTVKFGTVTLIDEAVGIDDDNSDYSAFFDAPADSYVEALKTAPSFSIDVGAGHIAAVPLANVPARAAFAHFGQCISVLRSAT